MEKQAIGELISAHLIKNRDIAAGTFTFEDDIFANGAVDSHGKLELTIFIEDQFCIQMDDEQLSRIGSIAKLISYIIGARAAKAAS